VESKRSIIRRVKYGTTALAILAALSASVALAEDFKTNDGKEYKDATVSRVELMASSSKPNPESQRFTSLNCRKPFRNGFIMMLRKLFLPPRHN
jgi:hypothetical protein